MRDRLHPVVHAMLEANGMGSVPEPEMVPLEVVDVRATEAAPERPINFTEPAHGGVSVGRRARRGSRT